jgi:sortase A
MGLGAAILIWVLWPILSFSLYAGDLSPTITPVVSAYDDVSSNPNTWFPTSPQKSVVTPVNTYSLSIPKLNIHNATVTIAGDDLDTSLVHYGGTALPGEYGTTVIFGHSTLIQLYNPTNYKTIFSLLPTLKVGDEIDIAYDGISYQYKVFDMTVTDPSDLSALEQTYDDSYLTLITCVPPGTIWERYHVKARLVRPTS